MLLSRPCRAAADEGSDAGVDSDIVANAEDEAISTPYGAEGEARRIHEQGKFLVTFASQPSLC